MSRSSSREIVALQGLDLAVRAGEVHGLLGLGFDVVRDKQRIRERLASTLQASAARRFSTEVSEPNGLAAPPAFSR